MEKINTNTPLQSLPKGERLINRVMPSEKEMVKAVYSKDSSYDGIFFTAVKTTNIFCRPSCTARKPLEKNIVFYPSAHDALFAGFKPCKRCRPLEIGNSVPSWVEKLLTAIDEDPKKRIRDYDLRKMGIEPARARRYFIKNYGMTFQAYSRSRRLGEAFSQIRNGTTLDEVIFGNGYESHSGFRDAFGKTFGSPPGKSGSKDCMVTSIYESPMGAIIIAANSQGICLAEFTDRRMLEYQLKVLKKYFRGPLIPGKNKFIVQAERELTEYFSGKLNNFKVPVVYPGTEFQQKVWSELIKIPYGKTISYEELANRAGIKNGARAVGTANGMNRIGIIIPCHRVVNKSGKLGGYGGGLWRKKKLLELEENHIF